MNALTFLTEPPGQPARPLYVLFGDDAFLKRESLSAVVRQVLGPEPDELAVTRFAGETVSLADVLDEVRTLPFLAPRRIAVVDNADPFVTAHRRELEAYTEHPAPTGTLVLNVKTWPSNTRLAKLASASGLAVDCKSPRAAELPPLLVRLAKERHGIRLDNDSAQLLVELVGDDVGLLVSELGKLAVAVGTRKTIRRDDVTRMVGAGRVEVIWRALDEATTGQVGPALAHLGRLMDAGEHPVGLLAAIGASLRKLHHAGQARRARKDLAEACREAGIPTYPGALDQTRKQHAHLGPARVERLPAQLLQADLDMKGSSTLDPRVVLERLFLELARPRTD